MLTADSIQPTVRAKNLARGFGGRSWGLGAKRTEAASSRMGRMTSYPGSFRKRRHAPFGAPPCMKTERSCTDVVLNAKDLRLFQSISHAPSAHYSSPQKRA